MVYTPKSDESPLKWDPPPIKQPWGLLISNYSFGLFRPSWSDFENNFHPKAPPCSPDPSIESNLKSLRSSGKTMKTNALFFSCQRCTKKLVFKVWSWNQIYIVNWDKHVKIRVCFYHSNLQLLWYDVDQMRVLYWVTIFSVVLFCLVIRKLGWKSINTYKHAHLV